MNNKKKPCTLYVPHVPHRKEKSADKKLCKLYKERVLTLPGSPCGNGAAAHLGAPGRRLSRSGAVAVALRSGLGCASGVADRLAGLGLALAGGKKQSRGLSPALVVNHSTFSASFAFGLIRPSIPSTVRRWAFSVIPA